MYKEPFLLRMMAFSSVPPIVPLGAVIEQLNCSLWWKKGVFFSYGTRCVAL